MKQIFEVRALNSAGEPFCAIKPKIFAKHIQNVFDLPDTKSHSGVKKSIEAIGKDILPRMKKVDEKPIKNAENAHKNGEKDAENPENVAEKEDQNLEKDSKKVEAKEVETPDKPAKKKAEKSSENPDKTADIDRKPENCEKPVERSENPPKRYINEAEDDKTVAEIAYSEKICGAEAKGEGVFEFSVLPERHGKFNVWVFVDAFNLVLFDKMYYADYGFLNCFFD